VTDDDSWTCPCKLFQSTGFHVGKSVVPPSVSVRFFLPIRPSVRRASVFSMPVTYIRLVSILSCRSNRPARYECSLLVRGEPRTHRRGFSYLFHGVRHARYPPVTFPLYQTDDETTVVDGCWLRTVARRATLRIFRRKRWIQRRHQRSETDYLH
jgi:hypothetical protein